MNGAGEPRAGTVCLMTPRDTLDVVVNLTVHRTGPEFAGVRGLGPGPHLIAVGNPDGVERLGCWVVVPEGDPSACVVALQWHAQDERLVGPGEVSPAAAESVAAEVLSGALDGRLGYCAGDCGPSWRRLSSAITDATLRRCGVGGGAVVAAGVSDEDRAEVGDAAADAAAAAALAVEPSWGRVDCHPAAAHAARRKATRDDDEAPGGAAAAATPVVAAAAADVSKYHLDGSARAAELVASRFGGEWQELLGELQLAFVHFLSLFSMPALRHWQELVALVCSCDDARAAYPRVFVGVAETLSEQLKQVGADFFEDNLSKENFLRPALRDLLDEEVKDADPALAAAVAALRKEVSAKFGFANVAELQDDDAPVVVWDVAPPPPAAPGGVAAAAPPPAHAARWAAIDSALSSVGGAAGALPTEMDDSDSDDGDGAMHDADEVGHGPPPASALALSELDAAAYPAFAAQIRGGEDPFMCAVRLLESSGTALPAANEARKWLVAQEGR